MIDFAFAFIYQQRHYMGYYMKPFAISKFCVCVSSASWLIFFPLILFGDSECPINNLSVKQGRVFLGWTSTKLG